MIIKKFTAKTEDEALKAAKAELGMQAVIMNVKKVKKKGLSGLFSKPSVEVTAAIEEEKADMGGTPVPLRSRREMEEEKASKIQTQSMKSSQDKKLSKYKDVLTDEEYDKLHPEEKKEEEKKSSPEKIDNLHVLIEQQLKSVMEQEAKKESADSKKEGSKEIMSFIKLIYTTLINNEVDEKYANDLIEEIEKLSKPGVTIDFLLSNIYQKLILKFGVSRGIVASDGKPKVIVFIGPTGVGKTTTIAKLASEMAVNQKKKVALVTTDTYRIKAAEQLRSYAEIMDVVVDVPFKVIYSADDIKNTLEELKEQDFIFVDTAGYSPKDKEKRDEMKHILDAAKEVADTETFLVLSVTTKYRDLLSICDIYKEMDDFKIIFTKLDETSTFGNMYNIRIYTGAEISYITDGQDVPDDIEAFNPQSIVRSILGGS
ncbi:MAG: flagellar biosynthesis protein FlhF [Lachnospiraceae bacterium]|nr:flagellar biosynthesis protein FlhF [Lachnospiraceae bacterium]